MPTFGAKGYGSPLIFTDLLLDEEKEDIELEHNTHIRIDRGTDTTVKGALFYVESVPKDIEFKGKIIFEVRDINEQIKNRIDLLFKILLHQIENREMHVGGMKSRGYGLCSFKINEIHYYSLQDLILGNLEEKKPLIIDQFLSWS